LLSTGNPPDYILNEGDILERVFGSEDFEYSYPDYLGSPVTTVGETANVSVSFWLKIESDTGQGNQRLLSYGGTTSERGWYINLDTAPFPADIKTWWRDTNGDAQSDVCYTSAGAFTTGVWYHVVATFDDVCACL